MMIHRKTDLFLNTWNRKIILIHSQEKKIIFLIFFQEFFELFVVMIFVEKSPLWKRVKRWCIIWHFVRQKYTGSVLILFRFCTLGSYAGRPRWRIHENLISRGKKSRAKSEDFQSNWWSSACYELNPRPRHFRLFLKYTYRAQSFKKSFSIQCKAKSHLMASRLLQCTGSVRWPVASVMLTVYFPITWSGVGWEPSPPPAV